MGKADDILNGTYTEQAAPTALTVSRPATSPRVSVVRAPTPAYEPLPTELPEEFDNEDLVPRLTEDPYKQVVEYRVRKAAMNVGLDPHIAASAALQESGFQPEAISPTGVKGTLQVTHPTANRLGYNRDDPDQNILAGVTELKRLIDMNNGNVEAGLAGYPDPKDRGTWIPNVVNMANKSREMTVDPGKTKTAEDILGVPTATEQPTTAPISPIQPSSPEQVAQGMPEYIKGFKADSVRPSVEDIAKEQDTQMWEGPAGKPLVKQTPKQATSDIIMAASSLLGPYLQGVGPAISASPKLAGAIDLATQSLLGGATGAAASANEGGSPVTGGIIGGAIPPALKGIGAGVSKIGSSVYSKLLGTEGKVADWAYDTFGPTISKGSLASKNDVFIGQAEAKLQSVLETNADKPVRIASKEFPDKVFRDVLRGLKSDAAPDAEFKAANMIATKINNDIPITPAEANIMKRLIGKEGYTFRGTARSTEYGKNMRKYYHAFKSKIEEAVTDEDIKLLNQDIANAMKLMSSMGKKSSSYTDILRPIAEASSAIMTSGAAIPAIAAGRLATSVPGMTGTIAAGNAIANPAVGRVSSALIPEWLAKLTNKENK